MCVLLEQWSDLIGDRSSVQATIQVEAILAAASPSRGGSVPFQVLASDDKIYWVKMAQNSQGPRVLATEQIVAACGKLLGAPVCETALIAIPQAFDGDSLENGTILRSGIAHASLNIENGLFEKWHTPRYRDHDNNRKRHAGYFALYDWCWGDDMQWLHDASDDRRTYSHDHGHFLPGGPRWTVDSLQKSVDSPHEIDALERGLDNNELVRIADLLDNVSRETICAILQAIPEEWPVETAELEAVGWFLERRRFGVSQRLRVLAERNSSMD